MTTYNQPILKHDANGNLVQESYIGDMKFRGDYTGTSLIYKGFARPGTLTSEAKWQIAKLTYSGSNVTQIDWAQDSNSIASSEFVFIWDNRATYTYS